MKVKVFTARNGFLLVDGETVRLNPPKEEVRLLTLEQAINDFLAQSGSIDEIIQTQSGRLDNHVTVSVWYN